MVKPMMRTYLFIWLLLSLSLLMGQTRADGVIAFSNIPPPTNYKPGGATVNGD